MLLITIASSGFICVSFSEYIISGRNQSATLCKLCYGLCEYVCSGVVTITDNSKKMNEFMRGWGNRQDRKMKEEQKNQ
jgi:hypothetical protein